MEKNDGVKNRDVSATQSLAEAAIFAKTGIPPKVQRNFFKAFGRILGAMTEVPAEWLEGKAREIRASSDIKIADLEAQQRSREIILLEVAKLKAQEFHDPKLVQRAINSYGNEIIREQEIKEDVLKIAYDELKSNPPKNDPSNELDDDWLNVFFKEISARSNEDFKIIFGKILAGEIKNPNTFSIGTVRALASLTPESAKAFELACNVSFSGVVEPRIITDPFGSAGNNGLAKFGLSYAVLAELVEAGLLRPEFNEWQELNQFVYLVACQFNFAGKTGLMISGGRNGSSFRLVGPAFTRFGRELRQVVSMTPNEEYFSQLAEWFESKNLTLRLVDVNI